MQYSIISKNNIEGAFRIDPEYYHPIHVTLLSRLHRLKSIKLREALTTLTDMGAFSLYKKEFLVDEGVPFLRVNNIGLNRLKLDSLIYITPEYNDILKKSQIHHKDVLLTTKAIIGMSCTVPELTDYYNMSQNLVRIRINENLLNPYYLSTFLVSKYGYFQTNRLATGNVQLYLNFENIGDILIPRFSDSLYKAIENTVKESERQTSLSESVFGLAQQEILSEIGLINYKAEHCISFVKNYSDTLQADRFDAEYYQPKYEKVIAAIMGYEGGWDKLGNLVTIKKCFEVGSKEYLEEGIPFIRVSNLSPFDISEEKYISEKLYQTITQHQPKKGEILFSKDATPGIAYYLNEVPQKMIPSGGILRLKNKSDKINNEYLTLVLNSILTREQVNRDVGGSVILHWRPDQVKETVIPILSEAKQTQIQQKVTESFNLRKQSKHLLECAKKAVEMAIEQDEQKAINWLEDETKEIQI